MLGLAAGVTALIGARLFGPAAGLVAGAVFGLSSESAHYAHWLLTEVLFTLNALLMERANQNRTTALIVDASGKFAYIIGNSARTGTQASVSAYRIDSSSGALILVPGSPFLIPTDPSSTNKNGPLATWLATTPDSRFLYVSDYNQLDLWTFAIDGATGALTLSPTSPLHMPHGSNEFTIDPSGLFAYFTSLYPNSTDCANFFPYTNIYAPDSVFIYSIDQSSPAINAPRLSFAVCA